jgi:uncharacterized protein YjdB
MILIASAAALSCDDPLAPGVGRVEIDAASLQIRAGETQLLVARVLDERGATIPGRRVHWTTQNASVATVSTAGLISAVSVGSTFVAASSGGRSATVAVTVTHRPVTQVRVTPATASVIEGSSVTLTAEGLHAGGGIVPGRPITWSSGSPAIATVTSSGAVAGVSAGTATIMASIDGIVGSALVSVQRAPVATVAITPSTATILVGQSQKLTATTTSATGVVLTGRSVTWSSSAPAIASVSSTGLVTALSPGAATITAASEGKSATARITATQIPVSAVTVSPSAATISLGASAQLVALPVSASGVLLSDRRATWVSNRPSIVSVTSSGVVVAIAPGTARITATVEGKSGSADITASAIPVSRVAVTPASATMPIGTTTRLTATPFDTAGNALTGRVVTWVSGAPSVATVDETGLVAAVSSGTAVIFATCEGQRASFTATVPAIPVATVDVTPATGNLFVGSTLQLRAAVLDKAGGPIAGKVPAWTTSAPSVAAVSTAGLVVAIAPGTATITATSDGVSGTASVTVSEVPVATVTVTPAAPILNPSQTTQLTATLRDASNNVLTGRAVTWSLAATAVATVSASGVVTAIAVGTTQIRAAAGGITGSATLTVVPPPIASIVVSPDPLVITVGGTAQLTAVVRTTQGTVATNQAITWSVADRNVATISLAGLVGALREGSTVITATAAAQGQANPARATVVLTVVPPTTSKPGPPSAATATRRPARRPSPVS